MNATAKLPLSQICDHMMVYLKAHALALTENVDRIPQAQYYEMCRLGSLMWTEVLATKEGAQTLEATLSEPAFVAFKARLLAKPKRTRKARSAA